MPVDTQNSVLGPDELLQQGYRYALSLIHDKARAEDLLQDAWVAVLQARGPLTRRYLYSAIRTRYFNLYKRERLVPMVSLDESLDTQNLEWESFDDGALFRVEQEALAKSLAQLRPLEREALYLSVIENYTAQEIADLTEQTRGTVLSLIHRARQKLRRLLANERHEEVGA